MTLGWWTVFTSHFVARDHIIRHIAEVRGELLEPLQLRFNSLVVVGLFALYELISMATFLIINGKL